MRAQRSISSTVAVVGLAFLALLSTSAHTVRAGESLRDLAAARATSVAASATSSTYTVRSGDTLGSIASRHGTTVSDLARLNQLANPNLLRIGQVLNVPGAGGATVHLVRAGDTLGDIAYRYGLETAQIAAANGLTGERIYIGQQLRLVPVSGTVLPTSAAYVARAGDTLSSIARRFGTTVRALQDANGIRDADLVAIGRALKIPAGSTGGGTTLLCPVQGGAAVMNDWGFPRSGGRFHEGNDLFAPRGTPAVATVSGTVVQTVGELGGHQVKLFGDDGVAYSYTHLDRFGSQGQVSAGTVIGYVGTTGNAAGSPPHVHFEIHPGGGAAVNPYPRVVDVC